MASATETLPHWDMTVVYPGLTSPEFEQGFRSIVEDIAGLAALFDTHGVGLREPTPLDEGTVQAFETVLARYNAVQEAAATIMTYIQCFISTDTRDDVAQAKRSELEQHTMRLVQLGTRFTAWIGSLDVEALIERSAPAREHAFALRKARRQAEHLMSPPEEDLATELNLTGGSAWAKLYDNWTSQLVVRVEQDGAVRELPMSEARNLAFEADRDLRRRAYEAELDTWRRSAVPIAAALNSIKGEVNTLVDHRGWESPLEVALFINNIDRQTLDVMLDAARDSFPAFRRYLRAKARALGLPALTWYDVGAPVGTGRPEWSFEVAAAFITEQFGTYSGRMRDLAARAFRERWIDAEPRPGKEDGGYCARLRAGESRILVNYTPAFDGVSTLAHELGHAYHNLNLAARSALQRRTPMTLAETASIFCENMVVQAALRRADAGAQVSLLDAWLQGALMVVVDISSRFVFEGHLFAARRQHALSVEELNGLMLDAQRETYGDGLDQSALHPYMWAVKSHYYSTGRYFYNFPYMYGFLFGLGLYARYQEDPAAFREGYDDLLSATGLADAATLAARFGVDIRTPAFWRGSLDLIRADVDRFERLVAATAQQSGDAGPA